MRRKLLLFLSVLCLLTAKAGVPYALGPVGFEDGTIPADWTQTSIEGTGTWQVEGGEGVTLSYPTGAKSGNYRVAIRRAQGSTEHSVTRLVSPAVDLTAFQNPVLHFAYAQAATYSYFDTLRVYYRAKATESWTLLKTFDTKAIRWQTADLELPQFMRGTAYQIAFEASDHAGKGVVLDDISIMQLSTCQAPTFTMIQSEFSTAFIEYTAGGTGYGSTADLFDLVVSDKELSDSVVATVTADQVAYLQKASTETSVAVSGLKGSTTYYVYLRTNCADNEEGYTDWVKGSFKTAMLKSLPYSEDFNLSRTTTDYASINGWTFGNDFEEENVPFVYVGTNSTYKARYSVDSTSYLAFIQKAQEQSLPIDSGKYAYAATPWLDGNLSECEVSFWGTASQYVYNGVTNYTSELTVGVMTDPTDFTTFTAIKTVKVETAYQFKHFTVSLAGYTGTGHYVALASNAKGSNMFFVDNFEVKKTTTAVPEDVRVYNVTPTGFDIAAQLWTADSWNVKVSTQYVRDASQLAAADCLLSQIGLTGATYHVNNADLAGKTVLVYLQAVKNGVASAWSFPVTLRVPTAGVVPIELTMNSNKYKEVRLDLLNHEIHGQTSGYKALDSVYFAPRGFDGNASAYFYPAVSTSTPIYDGGHLNLNGVDNYFAFPYVEDVTSLMVSFRLAVGYTSSSYAGQSRVAVGVMTDPYDLTTFVELGQFEGGTDTYVKCEQELSSYTGTGHYVAIRALTPASASSYGSYNALDNIVLKTIPTCKQATNVQATATVEDATLTWDANGMSKWLVSLYSNSSYTTLLKDTAVVSSTVTLTGLTGNTTYYYTVRTICGTDTLKLEDADQKYSFATKIGIPFVEKFTSTSVPTGWTRASKQIEQIWNGTTLTTYSGGWSFAANKGGATTDGYTAYVEVYGTSRYYWLITPDVYINADADGAVRLTFDAALVPYSSSYASKRNSGTDDQFVVAVSTDGGQTWTRSNSKVWNNLSDGTADYVYNDLPETMQNMSIDMSKYIGQTIRIGFYGESTVSNADNFILIDNVKLAVYDPNCTGIKTLSTMATGETTASVVWSVGGAQSAHLDVYADGEKSAFFSGDVTTSPYQLTGLSANTAYTVYAYQSCNAAGDTLTSSFRTDCGKSTVDDLGTMDFSDPNALACWTVGVGDTTGVGNTNLVGPVRKNVSKFGNVLYIEKPKKTTSSYYGNNYYAILPPLDIDSIAKYQVVFDAATTTQASDTTNVKTLYVGVITDPSDLSTLKITDTLTLQYAADSTALKSYAIGFDNYQGDYLGDFGTYVVFQVSAPEAYNDIAIIDNVRLEAVAGCHQVLDLTATDMKVDAATLKWSSEANSFRVVVSDKLCNPDTVSAFVFDQVVTGKSVTVSGLTASTNYYAYIKAICGVNDSSRWSGNTAFRTAYGVPFLEPFSAKSLTDGTWSGYRGVVFPTGQDTLDITNESTSDNTNGWYMVKVRSGVKGLKDYIAGVEIYGSTGTYDALLVSPQIVLPAATESDSPLGVSFVVAKSDYVSPTYSSYASSTAKTVADSEDDKFSVIVSEDGKKWARSASTVWASDGSGDYDYNTFSLTGKRCRVDLSAYKGKAVYLGFYTESTMLAPDTYFYLDSVKVDYYQPTCDGIANLSVLSDSVTTKSAALKIKSANASDTIEYVFGADSVNWATAIAQHTTSSIVILDGLQPTTTYVAYARSLCANGDTSAWTGPVKFTTNCLESAPLIYNFDDKNNRYKIVAGTSTYNMENCWKVRYTSNSYVPNLTDNGERYGYAYSGTTAMSFYKSSGSYYMIAALPEVDANLDTLQLSFMARAGYEYSSDGIASARGTLSSASSSYSHSIEIGTMDNLGDTATFHLIKEVELDPVATGTKVTSDPTEFWRPQVIPLKGAKGRYIVFLQRSTKSNYIYVDDVNLSKWIDCDRVENVTIDSIHSTTARAHWTSEASNFYVTLLSEKDTISFATTDTVCALTGLTANKNYTLKVVSVCGKDTTVAAQSNFSTLRVLPLEEDFTEGIQSDWSTLDGDVLAGATAVEATYGCWQYTSSNTYGINSPKVIWNLGYSSSKIRNSLLVTPQVEVQTATATNQVWLSFDMALTASSSSSAPSAMYVKERKFAVLVSEDNGTTWNKIDSLVWGTDTTYARRFDSIPTTSTHYSFDFSAYNGKTIRLAFYAYAPATSGYSYLHLTNILLKEVNPTCLKPNDLKVTNVQATAAKLSWQSVSTNFELQLATDKKFEEIVMDTLLTDTIFVPNTLNPGTKYYARVRMICGPKEYSDWTDACIFTTKYAVPFIEEFNTITTDYFPADWKRYNSISPENLMDGTESFEFATEATGTYSATTTWGYHSSYSKNALADAYHLSVEVYNNVGSWAVTPVIDLTQTDANKYLKFSFDAAMTFWNSATATTSTSEQKFYLIVSEDAGKTWSKKNLILWSDAAADSADFALASIPNEDGKNFKLDFTQYAGKNIQIAFGVTASSNDNRLHIDNVRLEEVDNVCFGIKNLSVKDVTATTATIAITPAAADSVWQYAYVLKDSVLTDKVARYDVNKTQFTISGLAAGTAYDVYVRAICCVGDTSEWKSTTLSTAAMLPFVEEFNNISTTYFPATWKRYNLVIPDSLFAGANFASASEASAEELATNTWGYHEDYSGNALADDSHLSVEVWSAKGSWAVTPVIDLTQADPNKFLKFSFDAALTLWSSTSSPSSTNTQKFYLLVSEDAGKTWSKKNLILWSDAAADSADYTLSSIPNGDGTNYKFVFSQYAGKMIQIAFGVSASSYDNRLHIDNVRLEQVDNACFGVKEVVNNSVTSTTATMQITPSALDKKWQYAYTQSDAVLQDATPRFYTDTTTFTVTGLQPGTEYNVYVRAICGVGDTSEWYTVTAKTDYAIPFVEDFDNVDVDYPDGWTRYSSLTPTTLFAYTDPFDRASELTSSSSVWDYTATYNANAFNDDLHINAVPSYSSTNYWFVSPKIELNAADSLNVALTFDAALTAGYTAASVSSSTLTYYFYVVVSGDGGHTWKAEDATIWSNTLSDADYTLSSIPNGTGENYAVNLTKYVGRTVQIAFCFGTSSSPTTTARMHLDNIHINAAKYCFDVNEVRKVSSTTSELSLEILNDNRLAKAWQYVSGLKGFNRADSLVHDITTSAFTLTGLQPGTKYDVYVRSICGSTDTSAWVGPFMFTTSYSVPFLEPFDDMSTVYFPADWKRYNSIAADDLFAGTKSFATATEYTTSSTTNYWGYNSQSANALNDENHLGVEVYRSYSGTWAVTPVIDLSKADAAKTLVLKFDAALTYWNSSDAPTSSDNQKFYVAVSEDAGATWNRSNAIVWSNAAADSATYALSSITTGLGKQFVFDFSKYIGKNIQIALGVEATANDNRLHIDNFYLYEADGICFAPTNVLKKEATTTSLKLTIVDDNNDSGWQYAYGNEGFVLSAKTTAYPTTGKEFELTGLTASTKYDVYLRMVCGVGDTTAWVGPFTFRTNYALPYSETFDDMATVLFPAEWECYTSIPADSLFAGKKSFATATEYTSTTKYETTWGYNSSYNKYALTDENHLRVEMYTTRSGSWAVSPLIEVTGVEAGEYVLFSFDAALTKWNGDENPTSSDNQKFYVAVSEDGGATWSRSNAILWSNAAADKANYRLDAIPTGNGSTYHFDFTKYSGKTIQIALGVEATANDNSLHIDNFNLCTSKSVCFGTSDLKQITATATTATVSFTETASATQWQYVYGENGFTMDDETVFHSIDSTAFTITGLKKDTYYDVYVRSICAVGDTSAWAGPLVVKTALGIPYTETFDDMATVVFPADWKRYKSITPAQLFGGKTTFATATEYTSTSLYEYYWGYHTSYSSLALADDNHLSVCVSSAYSGSWAVSPVIDLSTGSADRMTILTFDAALTATSSSAAPSSTDGQYFYVAVSEDGGQTWSKSNATIFGQTTNTDYLFSSIPNGNGATYEIDLSRFVGKTIQVALGIEASSSYTRLHIDNFSIRQIETVAYAASVCTSTDYEDDVFTIARADLKVGENIYTARVAGKDNDPDKAYMLTLSVEPSIMTVLYDTICQGYTYEENGYNYLAKYTDVIPMVFSSANGCDSLVELHLEVIPTLYVDTTVLACQSYDYKGTTYYSDKIFTDTLESSLGCDSIVRTFLRISSEGSSEKEWRTSICSGDSYSDEVFAGLTKAGVYKQTVSTAFGCDSTITLYLLVADADKKAVYDTVQLADLPYIFEGEIFLGVNTKEGDYTHDIQSSCGQVTLNMHVTSGTGISNTSVHSLQLTPNPARIGEPIRIVTDLRHASDYALSVVSSTGQVVYETTTPSVELPGLPIAGIYTVRLIADGKVYQARLLIK